MYGSRFIYRLHLVLTYTSNEINKLLHNCVILDYLILTKMMRTICSFNQIVLLKEYQAVFGSNKCNFNLFLWCIDTTH